MRARSATAQNTCQEIRLSSTLALVVRHGKIKGKLKELARGSAHISYFVRLEHGLYNDGLGAEKRSIISYDRRGRKGALNSAYQVTSTRTLLHYAALSR